MQDIARVGVVSSIEKDGGIRIYYQDREQTTAPMQLFSGYGEYAPPQIGTQVLVIHLSNDTSSGVVLGNVRSQEDAVPEGVLYRKDLGEGAYVELRPGIVIIRGPEIRFENEDESISLSEILKLEKRVKRLEEKA